jgi:hypothetical protein
MWSGSEDEEIERQSLPRRLSGWIRRPRKSKYWSDVCKDLGKYVLVGAVVAPFFGICSVSESSIIGLLALAIGAGFLNAGSKLDPGER